MKKTLIALAALAAGTAFAQSSVTIYGRLDAGYAKTTNVSTGMVSSFNNPSIIGFKGSEDLGGGLKANFGLESGTMSLENGTSGGLNFTRASWVGLSGNFGDFKLGRISSMATQGQAQFDLNGVSSASAMALAGISPVVWYGSSRRSAQFQYNTPVFSGFDAGLSYITNGDNANQGSRTSLRANYANGPLAVGFVAEQAAAAANRTAYGLAGSYNFGVAKAVIGWDRSENATGAPAALTNNTGSTFGQEAGQGYYLGVSAPFGATTVGAQYANNTALNTKALELFANYALSKRTNVYFDAVHLTSSTAAVDGVNRYAVGIQHNF